MTIPQSLIIARVSFFEDFTYLQREIVKFLVATGGEKSVAEMVRRKGMCDRTVKRFIAKFKGILTISMVGKRKIYSINIPVLAKLIGVKIDQNSPIQTGQQLGQNVGQNVGHAKGIYNNINNIYTNKQNKNKTHDVRKSFFRDDKILENEEVATVPVPTPVVPPAPPPPIPETPPIEEDEKPKPIIHHHFVETNKMVEQDHIPDSRKMVEQDFQAFWQAMPRKQGEMQARKAFQDAIQAGYSAKEIIAGAESYAKQKEGVDLTYCKVPANWLTEMRWLDVPIKQPSQTTTNHQPEKKTNYQGYINMNIQNPLKVEIDTSSDAQWLQELWARLPKTLEAKQIYLAIKQSEISLTKFDREGKTYRINILSPYAPHNHYAYEDAIIACWNKHNNQPAVSVKF